MLFISPRKIQLLFISMSSTLPSPPQPLLVSFFFGIVQYRCMNLPKTSDMIEHIKMIQIPTLSWQMVNASFWATCHKCFIEWWKQFKSLACGISRRACAKHWLSYRRKITYQLLLIGLFHKLISVQDVGHNMLHLHVAEQLLSLKVHALVSYLPYQWQWCWAEQTISIWHFSKQNISRLTQVKNETREARYTIFTKYISKWSKGAVWQ